MYPLNIFITLALSLTTALLSAQNDWQWGQEVRSSARDIATDLEGNTYVTWTLQDAFTIDGETFTSQGSSDIALSSFDCDGAHRWTKTIGGQNSDVFYGLGTDTLGGVYVTGRYNAMGNFDVNVSSDTIVPGYTVKGFFLVKYNWDGDFQWFRMPEDTAFIEPGNIQLAGAVDMNVEPNGACHLFSKLPVGTYGNEAFEATHEGTQYGGGNIYDLQYDSEGNCTGGVHLDLWYESGLFAKSEMIRDHNSGMYYLAGTRNDDDVFTFGGEEVTAYNYLVQFDPEGNVNWVRSDTGIQFQGKPSFDDFGNIYLTGGAENGATLDDFTINNSLSEFGVPFIVKFDDLGNVLYASNGSSTSQVNWGRATACNSEEFAMTGSYTGPLMWSDYSIDNTSLNANVFLARFDMENMELSALDTLQSSETGLETPYILTTNQEGEFYVGGQFTSQLYVADDILYNQAGQYEGFVAKFGSDSCYCPIPEAALQIDSIANQAEYVFTYTGTQETDSVVWDFGDGTSVTGTNLEHLYAETGTYTVCVTAYNECGSDTTCTSLDALGPVGLRTIEGHELIQVYPNPATNLITVANSKPGMQLDVFNAVGQQVKSKLLLTSPAQLDIGNLTPGIYLLRFSNDGQPVGYGRVLKK